VCVPFARFPLIGNHYFFAHRSCGLQFQGQGWGNALKNIDVIIRLKSRFVRVYVWRDVTYWPNYSHKGTLYQNYHISHQTAKSDLVFPVLWVNGRSWTRSPVIKTKENKRLIEQIKSCGSVDFNCKLIYCTREKIIFMTWSVTHEK